MIPKPIAQFCRATSEPLTSGGATSALYIGTSILFAPMPNPLDYGVVRHTKLSQLVAVHVPVMKRPPRIAADPLVVAVHCTITPMMKIVVLRKMLYFRDKRSAMNPA